MWDATFTFEACCATDGFEAGGQTCAHGDTTYANCCTAAAAEAQPPAWWCGDDSTFTDGAGYTCGDWASGDFSCTDDTATYTAGDRSALFAACSAACGMCQSENWNGVAECWHEQHAYSTCCLGDADGDGEVGDSRCWTGEYNFDTCQCIEPTEPVCDADQVMLRPDGSGFLRLSVAACDYGLGSSSQLPSAPPHGLCVWDELWGNGWCDDFSGGPTYDPNAGVEQSGVPWYDVWKANLNCEQAGFGEFSSVVSAG